MTRSMWWRANVRFLLISLALVGSTPLVAQEKDEKEPAATHAPKAADGKKLFTALDALRLRDVGGFAFAPAPSMEVSPEGTRVVYTVSETSMEKESNWKLSTQVWSVTVDAGQARQLTRGEHDALSAHWSPDSKNIAFLSARTKESESQVWMIAADGGEAWEVTAHEGGVTDFALAPDGTKLLFLAADQPNAKEKEKHNQKDDAIVVNHDLKMTQVWIFDLEKRQERRLTEGEFDVVDAQWSPNSKQISYTSAPTPQPDVNSQSKIWVVDVASGQRHKIGDEEIYSNTPRWSPDGVSLAYLGSKGMSDMNQVYLFVVPANGGSSRKLTAGFQFNAGSPHWSVDGKAIYFSTEVFQAQELFTTDVATGATTQLTTNGGVLALGDLTRDGKTAIVAFSDATHPAEIYRYDLASGKQKRLTDHNAWLREYSLGTTEIVKWKSKDRLEIEGVLTKPVGFVAGKKYPLLLNPHGGPSSASHDEFNPQEQVFAANGYMVLEPNFRGSTGRGEKFAQLNRSDWGKGDYEDCIAGVQALIDRGLADPDRLGAAGWSYGGYMTLWILTQTMMFKAVSAGAGLSNLYSMYSQTDVPSYFNWFMGGLAPWEDEAAYWNHSPMKYVNQVKTPTLLLHGESDTRVPLAQSKEFYRALIERKVPVEFVIYPREEHGLTEPRHKLDRMRRYLTFFGKYLNNLPVTEAAE